MKITKIEKHTGSGMWHGTATIGAKNYMFYFRPRSFLHMTEQDERNPRCWMNVDPPKCARRIVLKGVRTAKAA